MAEGVETQAQRDFLTDVGCDLLQGYLFSQPVPPKALVHLIADQPDSWKPTARIAS